MNLAQLQQKLMAAARQSPLSDQVPYAFEQRVMARLKGSLPEDALAWWARALWRGAASCVAAAVLLAVICLWPQSQEVTLSQLYDSTLYSAVEQLNDSW